jgi:hypothetical protein
MNMQSVRGATCFRILKTNNATQRDKNKNDHPTYGVLFVETLVLSEEVTDSV